MPVADLSAVSEAVRAVIQRGVAEAGVIGGTLDVSLLPPDRVTGGDQLSLFLYHVRQLAGARNGAAWSASGLRGGGSTGQAPMGLLLYYQLTANNALEAEGSNPAVLQRKFGAALKALHDYGEIRSGQLIGGHDVFSDAGLTDTTDRFEISMLDVEPEEAADRWSAHNSPLRLSAYYQVSVVFLEPRLGATSGPPVLDPRGGSAAGPVPYIRSSRSTHEVESRDGTRRSIDMSPAQAPGGGRITLVGSGWMGGGTIRARLHDGASWTPLPDTSVVFVDATHVELAIPDWVRPGLYGLELQVERHGGVGASNRTPIAVTARVTETRVVGPGTLEAGPSPFEAGAALEVYLDRYALTVTRSATLEPGQARVVVATGLLHLRAPSSLAAGERVLLRVVVNGAESAPLWVEVPP
ncbi:MAG: DUF4255 domain-containing protein [Myxococcales bacterium]|nr:DUF4255 domain-containing protein [Myxococcales bacterium]